MRFLALDLDVPQVTFSQKVSKGLGETSPFIEWCHAHAWQGTWNTGTSLQLRPMQMATVGAAICMSQGMDRNWTEVIYAATIATT